MKKRTIRRIILAGALSLFGLLITQILWLNRALQLADKQYSHRVTIALREVVERMKEDQEAHYDCRNATNIMMVVDTVLLDSLIREYFEYQELDDDYNYAVARHSNYEILYCRGNCEREDFLASPYKKCLYHLWPAEHHILLVHFPKKHHHLFWNLSTWLLFSLLFLVVVILTFSYTMHTVIRQKKLSEMKTDFINNMTHEFKTPLATISMASEVLIVNQEVINPERIGRYAGVINEENLRLQEQVDRILQTAIMDKGEYHLNKQEVFVNTLVERALKHLCLEECEDRVKLHTVFEASPDRIMADPMHLTNIIKNLLSNAHKFSGDDLQVSVTTASHPEGVVIKVRDNGIGIDKQAQKLIFDKFYRVPTGDIHNVKGFGLGLYYVKAMVAAHQGRIEVKSEVGQGSCFRVFLPFGF